ncbi:MAG: efflux RND transporter periplasmic adaptor subunit [Balneolaceae bacterium]|nr:efflux RND transporter periplasmic adaptor subunit [Balneolaceae bacterium]
MNVLTNYNTLLGTILMGLAVLTSACSGNQDTSAAQQKGAEIQAEILKAERQVLLSSLQLSGTVKSEIRSEIGTRTSGEIESIPFDIGDEVRKGELIVHIKDDHLEARKDQVEAAIIQASVHFQNTKKNYNRIKTLVEQGSATQKEWDDIEAAYQSAEARLRSAQGQLNEINDMLTYTQIKAPYNGVIVAKYVDEGDMANPGYPLLAIEKQGGFKVVVAIPESIIQSVSRGDTLQLQVPAAASAYQRAVVARVGTSAAPGSRQYSAELKFTDAEETSALHSGMYAIVYFPRHKERVVAVATEALVKRGQLTGVYTLNENQEALLRWIRTGQEKDGMVEVLSGLKEGEYYVKNSERISRDGIKVEAVN